MHQLPPSMLPLARRFRGPDEPLTGKGTKAETPAPTLVMKKGTAGPNDSAVAVRGNDYRKYLTVQNQSAVEKLYVSTQGPAMTSPAIILDPGVVWPTDPQAACANDLWIGAAIDSPYLIVEG